MEVTPQFHDLVVQQARAQNLSEVSVGPQNVDVSFRVKLWSALMSCMPRMSSASSMLPRPKCAR